MGFIDYQGTKENRYTDVLEFAKAQQEEEARRLESARITKWLAESLKDSRYAELTLNDLIKYIIVKYRKLAEQKEILISEQEEQEIIDDTLLWKDFSIAIITRRLENMGLPAEKRNAYYQTFMSKVFKLEGYTSAEKHYLCLTENPIYKRYFADCFDLVQEKQFWKWLGRLGDNDGECLIKFVTIYKELSILLGYYLFQEIRPTNSEWMRRLDLECQVLEKLVEEYARGRYKQPNYSKLQNPLYEQPKKKQVSSDIKEPIEEVVPDVSDDIPGKVIVEPARPRRPQLNRNLFEELLQKQNLQDYTEACRLLRRCELPENMDELYKDLIIRMSILQESIDKFADVYQPDMYQFYEYYIPEALQLTVTYLEYLDVGIGEKVLLETEKEILDAVGKLLIAINDKIDEIYKFASIEIKAKAKALESLMSQDGYVDQNFKIN